MGSNKSYLVISNQTDSNIVIKTDVRTNKDWDGNSRPDKNFDDVRLTAYDSLEQREELNSNLDHGGEFTMTITFENGTFIKFTSKQEDAFTKKNKSNYKLESSSTNDFILNHSSGSDTNSFTIIPREEPNNSTWMEQLMNQKPDIRLSDVVIPASHDAGMYAATECFGSSPEWTITQTLSINEQLKAGSRYFDLRVADNGKIYHASGSFGCEGYHYTDILEQVKEFINLNGKNEVVILKLSHCKEGGRKDVVKNTKRILADKLYKEANSGTVIATKKLVNMKGKVVCVFEHNEFEDYINAKEGIIPYKNFGENHAKDNALYAGLSVYDNYSEKTDFEEMKSDQLDKLKDCGGLSRNYLFLLSWTLTGNVGDLDVQSLATRCKPNLPDTLKDMKQGEIKKPNFVYTDFVDNYLSRIIINLNWAD